VSDVTVLSGGYSLFSVSAPRGAEGAVDEKLKEEIRRELYESKFKDAVKEYVNEELPKKYHVEIKL
jgi:hypothetical protein